MKDKKLFLIGLSVLLVFILIGCSPKPHRTDISIVTVQEEQIRPYDKYLQFESDTILNLPIQNYAVVNYYPVVINHPNTTTRYNDQVFWMILLNKSGENRYIKVPEDEVTFVVDPNASKITMEGKHLAESIPYPENDTWVVSAGYYDVIITVPYK